MSIDPTIKRAEPRVLRQNPDARLLASMLNVPQWDLLAYQALADSPFGRVRLLAVFPSNPFSRRGIRPTVLALDGPRQSLHRNASSPEAAQRGESADLCLFFDGDPLERRWTVEAGLLGLFDLARRHLAAEHIWRLEGRWPMEDAAHGDLARRAASRPALAVPPLRPAGSPVIAMAEVWGS